MSESIQGGSEGPRVEQPFADDESAGAHAPAREDTPAEEALAGTSADEGEPQESGELVSRLRIIEQQPLESRAEAYRALHDELAGRLDSAPSEPEE